MSASAIQTSIERSVCTITISRPEARNALRVADKLALTDAIRDAQASDGVRAIVLRGDEHAFCAGTDIKEMAGFGVQEGVRMLQAEAAMFDAVVRARVPVVAAVHGPALGAGCVLVYCCDLALSDPSGRFGQPEIRNGVPAPVHAALLPRVVGLGLARKMIFLGEVLEAPEALEAGLISELTPQDELYARAQEIGETISHFPPNGVALQKEIVGGWFRYGFDSAVETSVHIAASAFATDEPKTAISTFLKK